MNEILRFTFEEVRPARDAVLANQGVPRGASVSASVEANLRRALELAATLAEPVALLAEIERAAFATVYAGEGRNEALAPLNGIHPQAERRALFVATVGPRLCSEIGRRFTANEPALGAMLDAVASATADRLADQVRDWFYDRLAEGGHARPGTAALAYSPGYCGWHISGQRKLFDVLRPEPIGVTLNESFLMQPLKSVSGVVLVGPAHMHAFDDTFPYCASCETHGCRLRIEAALRRAAAG